MAQGQNAAIRHNREYWSRRPGSLCGGTGGWYKQNTHRRERRETRRIEYAAINDNEQE